MKNYNFYYFLKKSFKKFNIIFILLYCIYIYKYKKIYYIYLYNLASNDKNRVNRNNINDIDSLISRLNLYENYTKQTNIIFTDYFFSKTCYDNNAFILFEYYLKNNIDTPYYIINKESDFYKSLKKENKTKNLIFYLEQNSSNFFNDLYEYFKDAKIIVNSYSIFPFQKIAKEVSYIKYLKINHGVKYFKLFIAKREFIPNLGDKTNVICSSPFEYEFLINVLKYKKEYIHIASLPRYERFINIKKNRNENKCILVSFTYRPFNNSIFQKSKYKQNLENLLNDIEFVKNLKDKKVELIYMPHHEEINLGKNYSKNMFIYAKIENQSNLSKYIEKCSLLITDFSSISFDFMFQNKPVLFYDIDKNESEFITENKNCRNRTDKIYFGNYFEKSNLLYEKIKYYIDNKFAIDNKMKKKYDSVFFIKKNIISTIVKIINNIMQSKAAI